MPNIGQLKDLLQELLGNVELSLEMTNFLLASGRREVEKRINAYWMTVSTSFNLIPGVNNYTITSGIINRSAFKEIYFASWRVNGTSKWNPLPHRNYEILNNQFDAAEAGEPRFCAVDNVTWFVFPNPTLNYQIQLHNFEWQSNPTDNVGTADGLMDRFPEALLYGAASVGTVLLTKDQAMAKPWLDLLVAQLPAIQTYSDARIKKSV